MAETHIRLGLTRTLDRAWATLGKPGTWWTGRQRLDIAAETRHAMNCQLCRDRKAALSPYGVPGDHDHLGRLSDNVVEAVHRIRTDAGRLTESWFKSILSDGLTDTEYAELTSIVAIASAVDTFDRGMGFPLRDLPEAEEGPPSYSRPAGAKGGMGWLDTLTPEDLTDDDPDPFSRFGAYNIQRAISLVPQSAIDFFELDVELYFYERDFPQRTRQLAERALTAAQIELIAARAASLNGCFY